MKDKIKYYLLLLAFLFIMALILWFFHDWIEQYSNSLMVLITFIYVVATIEICRANIKSAEATKEQLEESKHQFAENERLQMMPYFEIIVHDDIRDFVECIELTISKDFNKKYWSWCCKRLYIHMVQFGRMLSAERPWFYSICSGRRKKHLL